ncbi:hypothetical protein MBLNU459_g4088t1 [Dothideomycetes sp. NU459]
MGKLVRLIGVGIGLASEAYQASKEPKPAVRSPQHPSAVVGSSNAPRSNPIDDLPPQYAEVTDERAERLIAQGQAVPVDEKKQSFEAEDDSSSEVDDDDDDDSEYSLEDNEQDWALDEAADPPAYSEVVAGMAPSGSNVRFPPPPPPPTGVKLPHPVILPQRRPGSKNRGFVRAYAPDLAACGLDQATFLDFLETLHAEIQASPVLTALCIAGMTPTVIAMAVSTAMQEAAGATSGSQRRYRANAYLDKVNNELFAPRGLYAMMVKYKVQTSTSRTTIRAESIDLSKEAMRSGDQESTSSMSSDMRGLRLAAGTSRDEENSPTICAPLIFPGVDAELAASASSAPGPGDEQGFTGKWKSSQRFVAEYMDRRAQAIYMANNSDTTLTHQISPDKKPQFRSRFSDPNHPASSGHPIALLSGGLIPVKGKAQRRMEKRARKETRRAYKGAWKEAKRAYKDERRANRDERRIARGLDPKGPRRQKRRDLVVGARKVLKADVLYLTVVNLPSLAEMGEARQVLAC